jgi:hypothetical protein
MSQQINIHYDVKSQRVDLMRLKKKGDEIKGDRRACFLIGNFPKRNLKFANIVSFDMRVSIVQLSEIKYIIRCLSKTIIANIILFQEK